jgi:hypothetical protein
LPAGTCAKAGTAADRKREATTRLRIMERFRRKNVAAGCKRRTGQPSSVLSVAARLALGGRLA